jgi:hypothetical protein
MAVADVLVSIQSCPPAGTIVEATYLGLGSLIFLQAFFPAKKLTMPLIVSQKAV